MIEHFSFEHVYKYLRVVGNIIYIKCKIQRERTEKNMKMRVAVVVWCCGC